jgi:hypothetical protein
MATINVRNESNEFIKLDGDSYVHKPSDSIEDLTNEFLNISSDLTFNVYSDEECVNFIDNFKIIFRIEDGVYLNLGNFTSKVLEGDLDYKSNIELVPNEEQKLLDWNLLSSSSVINLRFSNV